MPGVLMLLSVPLPPCRFGDDDGIGKLECTATILPGRVGAGVKASKSSALLDIKPK
jgi:hypothetical protein